MINYIITEAKKFIASEEYDKSIENLGKQFALSEDELGSLYSVAGAVMIGEITEEGFVKDLTDRTEIKTVKAVQVYNSAREQILTPFKKKLAISLSDAPEDKSSPSAIQDPISLLRTPSPAYVPPAPRPQPPAQQPPRPTPPESLAKEDIMSAIENPPRTVIKRYVLEHEPITDPEHLIDDTVDERPRLEA